MRVLIADQVASGAIIEMQHQGMGVDFNKDLSGDSLIAAIKDFDPNILVVRSTKVPVAAIDAGASLQLVVRAGAGTDTIDVTHCARQGIFVANCPGKNAHAVAELAMGLMLSLDRRMAEGNQLLHEGKWDKTMFSKCVGIKGRTLGLIGFGPIA